MWGDPKRFGPLTESEIIQLNLWPHGKICPNHPTSPNIKHKMVHKFTNQKGSSCASDLRDFHVAAQTVCRTQLTKEQLASPLLRAVEAPGFNDVPTRQAKTMRLDSTGERFAKTRARMVSMLVDGGGYLRMVGRARVLKA